MKHTLRNACLLALGAGLALACTKTAEEGTNIAVARQFEAWRAIYYPDAEEKDGIYIIEDEPGTGLEWRQSLPVTLLTYTMQNLDGTVQYNTREDWAKRLGTWDAVSYYGPQYALTGEKVSYAGLDRVLEGMRQGGTRTAIVPSWLMTYDRHDTVEEYMEYDTEVAATIYTITFLDQTANLTDYEYALMKDYCSRTLGVTDTLSSAAVFFKSRTEFVDEPVELPSDTTIYINYIGRRIYDNQVFDTSIADTAKFYGIYDPTRAYGPVSVTMAEKASEVKMGTSTVVSGFGYGLKEMHADESASFVFGYNLGYGSSGGTDKSMVPPYAALRFDVDLVPEP